MKLPTLLAPLRYLLIQHERVRTYNVYLPFVLALFVTAIMIVPGDVYQISANDGYLDKTTGVLATLGGFFIAALTLVTMDQNGSLDQPIAGIKPPVLRGEVEPITRRRFLSYLFGYSAFSSFVLSIASMMATTIGPTLGELMPEIARYVSTIILLFLFNFWASQLVIATLLGLYYFTERLPKGPDRHARLGNRKHGPSNGDVL